MIVRLKGLGWVTYKWVDWMGLTDFQADLITLSDDYMTGISFGFEGLRV